jgi:hypothetical protein
MPFHKQLGQVVMVQILNIKNVFNVLEVKEKPPSGTDGGLNIV